MVKIIERCYEIQGDNCLIRMSDRPDGSDLMKVIGYNSPHGRYCNISIDLKKALDLMEILNAYIDMKNKPS